jgi:uncharacterized protein with ATP-grasp and redox domains
MFKQALNTARLVSDNPDVHLEILSRVAELVAHPDLDTTPAALSQPAYEIVAEVTGVTDPYQDLKKQHNTAALDILPRIQERVTLAEDSLDAALRAAAAGNVIDLGIGHAFQIEEDIESIMHQEFTANDIESFRRDIHHGVKVLFLGDNAGEIVFDQVLVHELQKAGADVTFTVKSGPVINDATLQDAVDTGMTALVPVIETGGNDIGVNWANVSDEFRNAFEFADVIVSKGHGNFETCNDRPENIYFLLKAKCEMVADELGVKFGDLVFKKSR